MKLYAIFTFKRVETEAKIVFMYIRVYRMNLQRALKLKRVKNEGISNFEV